LQCVKRKKRAVTCALFCYAHCYFCKKIKFFFKTVDKTKKILYICNITFNSKTIFFVLPHSAVLVGLKTFFYNLYFRFISGCFMSANYYQVCATFKLTKGKPQLVKISLHTTPEYYPFIIYAFTSSLSNSRFFLKRKEANNYINYLLSRYPKCGLSFPKLDALQGMLF